MPITHSLKPQGYTTHFKTIIGDYYIVGFINNLSDAFSKQSKLRLLTVQVILNHRRDIVIAETSNLLTSNSIYTIANELINEYEKQSKLSI